VRILYLSHYALPHVGGIETAIDALAREMMARGHEVTHVAAGIGEPASQPPGGGRVVRVPASNILETKLHVPYPLFSPRLIPTLRREVRDADIVHAHGFLYLPSVLGLRMGREGAGGGPARVLTEHVGTVDYGGRTLNAIESVAISSLGRASVRAADAVIVLNDAVHREIQGLDSGARVLTIENGVDLERFHPADAEERAQLRAELGWDKAPRVLFVGRFVPKKRPELAIDAARRAEGAFELVMVGRGRAPELPDHVDLLGELPMDRLARLYRAADVLLLPSRGEGFPLAVQEAMASGLPVVLADDPIYEPYLDGAGPGARFVPPEAIAIARTLTKLLRSPSELEEASARALAHARARFGWRPSADRHEQLYQELS
jgi:glycosyltransferase involved in cell wall biosynthesis